MAHSADLEELLRLTEPAATAFVNGDPVPYQELFAHNDEVTLTGPFGGEPGRGWTNLAPRMARAAALFKDGTTRLDLVHAMIEGDLACLVMVERSTAKLGGRDEVEDWVLRVTQVYRKIDDRWRVIHRHADPLVLKRTTEDTFALLRPAVTARTRSNEV
jgi:ketosteroid isomerase-like protein